MTVNCKIHPQIQAEIQCHICHNFFCSNCFETIYDVEFCHEHAQVIKENEWSMDTELICHADNSHEAVLFIDEKIRLYLEENLFSFIVTEMFIDEDSDQIYSKLKWYKIKKGSQSSP